MYPMFFQVHFYRSNYRIPKEDTLLLCKAIQKKPLILDPFLEMLSGCIYFSPASGNLEEKMEDETTINMNLK